MLQISKSKIQNVYLKSKSNSSFYYSFFALPSEKRKALSSIYAYCRYLDDIVDKSSSRLEATKALSRWKEETENLFMGKASHPILAGLKKYIDIYSIPQKYFLELIKGVEMDLTRARYNTFTELHKYCYRVASVVGLICAEVFGYQNATTLGYAVDLGIALQLTNILRDIKADALMGRIYLPLEDMKRFGYSEEDLLTFRYSPSFIELMRFESERAWGYYRRAIETLPMEDRKSMVAAEIMRNIYARILQKIELSGYDVFSHAIQLSNYTKLSIAISTWIKNVFKLSS